MKPKSRFMWGLTHVVLAGIVLTISWLVACTKSPQLLNRDFVADFQACVKVEGTPTRVDHSAINKCLVDRFGWPIDKADRGADSIIKAVIARVDSTEQARRDSIHRAYTDSVLGVAAAEQQRRVDMIARARWIGDRSTMLLYRSWPDCQAVRTMPKDEQAVFPTEKAALVAGYTLNGYSGCGETVPK